MAIRLTSDVAIVTGAGEGIGAAIAHRLAAAGARVAVTSRTAADAERIAAELGPDHFGCGMDVNGAWRNLPGIYAVGRQP